MKKRIKIDHLSTLCIGLDIGSRKNYLTALDFDSNMLIKMKPVPNAASGVTEMESMILAVLSDIGKGIQKRRRELRAIKLYYVKHKKNKMP